ncbi:MAG: T9SS type A sorting domain-containing protein [Bacteroidota bacterium]
MVLLNLKTVYNILLCTGLLLLLGSEDLNAQFSGGSIDHFLGISGEFEAPLRLATDQQGNTYITDAVGRAISKYDPSGNFLQKITVVPFPVSVAVNGDEQLFIGDGETGNIYRYDETGGAKEFYTGTGYPTSMVFSPDNTLYVADSKLQEIIVLDLSGNVTGRFGSGIVDFPTGLAFDANNQRILVGEHGGKGTGFNPVVKVWMFDLQGNLIKSFGSHGAGEGQFYRVQGLTVGKCGDIYVVDPFQARITIFDEEGGYLSSFGDFGLGDGQLNIPMDIVFTGQQHLMVSSLNNGSLELFSVTDTLPSSNLKSSYEMICSGESAALEIEFTGTAPWDFTYTVDGINPTIVSTSDNPYLLSVSEAGHYEVTALTDANFTGTCFTGSAVVAITEIPPSSLMTGDTTICAGETADISIAFTGSPPWSFTYTQDGVRPTTVTTTNNPHILTVSEAGHYEVSGLTGGGCMGTSFTGGADIVVKQLPTATLTDGNNQIYIYPDDSTDLNLELGGIPPWKITYTVDDLDPVTLSDINESNYKLGASAEGTYEVKLVTDSSCSSDVSFGYPEVLFYSSPPAPTSHIDEGELFICPGEYVPIQVHFTGRAPWAFTYKAENLTTTIYDTYTNPFIINAIYNGTYEVTELTDKYGEGTDLLGSAKVSYHPLPVSNFSYVPENLELSLFSLSENADYFYWDFGDGFTSTEENPVHIYSLPGVYSVSLSTASEQCTGSTISRTVTLSATSVLDAKEKSFRIYPNPADGIVTIEDFYSDTERNLEIISLNGTMVYAEKLLDGIEQEVINLDHLKAGVYLVRISSKNHVKTGKLILH